MNEPRPAIIDLIEIVARALVECGIDLSAEERDQHNDEPADHFGESAGRAPIDPIADQPDTEAEVEPIGIGHVAHSGSTDNAQDVA